MDSKIRNLSILLVISVVALVIGMVFYMNKDKTASGAVAEETEAIANRSGAENEQTGATASQKEDAAGFGQELSKEQLQAFLQDETFFDPELPNKKIQVSGNEIPKLYLLASSVQQDIRVAVLDEDGETLQGYPLYISIDGSQYKDLDQDGIITVPELSAGDYFVSLEPVEGYEVPKDPMHVSVKETLEYKVIEDISYLILTEDDIDVSAEDTEVQSAKLEAEESENTGIITAEDTYFGIDVSKWQKEIDWDKVAACGVKFAIIRCGYRGSSTGCLVEDPYFVQNIEGAKKAGIKVGVYFFTQAVNTVEAVEEASMVAALCKDYELDYPVFIDTESAGGNGRADGLDAGTRTDVCEAFCKTIEDSGYRAGVYASRCWYYEHLEDERLQDFVLWDAEYRESPLYTGDYKIWQYTSGGYIDGINTRVDLNISYVDFTR